MPEIPLVLKSDIAYDIEAQALLVQTSQSLGELMTIKAKYWHPKTVEDLGQTWFMVGDCRLWQAHCNTRIWNRLREGGKMIKVETMATYDAFTLDGAEKQAIAIIVLREGILYQSPGFNLRSFRKNNRLYKEGLEWLHSDNT